MLDDTEITSLSVKLTKCMNVFPKSLLSLRFETQIGASSTIWSCCHRRRRLQMNVPLFRANCVDDIEMEQSVTTMQPSPSDVSSPSNLPILLSSNSSTESLHKLSSKTSDEMAIR